MNSPSPAAENLSLETFLRDCQSRVNNSLQALLAGLDLNPRLLEAMGYATLNGGKRIRPVLVYAAAEAVNAPVESADTPACAVELIHSYSLAHDDLPAMDDDDLRRGQPSLHKAYDDATAILVGDALQCFAFEILSQADSNTQGANRMRMLRELARASGAQGMVGGQIEDFEAVGNQLSLDQLQAMHEKKTGALITASVLMGALCEPDIDEHSLSALRSYGRYVGLAFQVQDDVLDETADTSVLGKPQGSDRLKDKPTYVSLLGLDGARSKALELVEQAQATLDDFSYSAGRLRELASYIVRRSH